MHNYLCIKAVATSDETGKQIYRQIGKNHEPNILRKIGGNFIENNSGILYIAICRTSKIQ